MIPEHWAEVRESLQSAGFELAGLSDDALRKAMTPVMALARAIAHYTPELLQRDRLRLAVVGAEWLDALDAGRWYSLLGVLFRQHIEVSGVLIGPQLETAGSQVARLFEGCPSFEPHKRRLHEYLVGHDIGGIDLAVLYQPGFDNETGVLNEGGLPNLLRGGIPVFGSSYSNDEFLMESGILKAFGYSLEEPIENPLALDVGREDARWAAILWRLDGGSLPKDAPDKKRLADIQRLSRMLAHSKLNGLLIPLESLGQRFAIARRQGGQRQMLYIFDRYYADQDTGEIFVVQGERLRRTDVRIAPEALASYPGGVGASTLDRAVWSARIKEKYLLGG